MCLSLWVRINAGNCINYQYDNDLLLTGVGDLTIEREVQRGGLIKGSGLDNISTDNTYNNFAEILSVDARYQTTSLYNTSYIRDKLGRITQKSETIQGTGTTVNYGYDEVGRLETANKDGQITTYSYDSNGNRLSKINNSGTETGIYDDQDRLKSYANNNYTYTENGDLQSKTQTTTGTVSSYDYDVLGNLLKVDITDGTTTTTIDYVIDGSNRRIGKKVNGVLQQGFLYGDPLNPVAELNASNQIIARFIYGTKINVPDYMIKGGVTYRILSDHLGSPRLVVNSTNGAIIQRMDYDEFGNVTQDSNPGFQPFGFAGGIYDRDTHLTRFGVRDYDAESGRWTNKDPIGFNGGDSNIYAYVGGDPVGFVDPLGLEKCACDKGTEPPGLGSHPEAMVSSVTGPFGQPNTGFLTGTQADMFTTFSAKGPQLRASAGATVGGIVVGAITAFAVSSNPVGWAIGSATAVGSLIYASNSHGNIYRQNLMYIEFHFSHDNGWHTSTTTHVFDKNGNEINSWSTGCEVHGPNG